MHLHNHRINLTQPFFSESYVTDLQKQPPFGYQTLYRLYSKRYTTMNKITRYEFIYMAGAATAGFVFTPTQLLANKKIKRDKKMYGLIGKIITKDGQRDELIKILLEETTDMPGCLSYIIAKDSKDDNAI